MHGWYHDVDEYSDTESDPNGEPDGGFAFGRRKAGSSSRCWAGGCRQSHIGLRSVHYPGTYDGVVQGKNGQLITKYVNVPQFCSHFCMCTWKEGAGAV